MNGVWELGYCLGVGAELESFANGNWEWDEWRIVHTLRIEIHADMHYFLFAASVSLVLWEMLERYWRRQ